MHRANHRRLSVAPGARSKSRDRGPLMNDLPVYMIVNLQRRRRATTRSTRRTTCGTSWGISPTRASRRRTICVSACKSWNTWISTPRAISCVACSSCVACPSCRCRTDGRTADRRARTSNTPSTSRRSLDGAASTRPRRRPSCANAAAARRAPSWFTTHESLERVCFSFSDYILAFRFAPWS